MPVIDVNISPSQTTLLSVYGNLTPNKIVKFN
jgi:hypothetical protein